MLLHGLGGKSTLFYKQADYLSQHYNLLFIDLPGYGDSTGLDVNYYVAADVVPKITEVLEKLQISRAHFLTLLLGTYRKSSQKKKPANVVISTFTGCGK